MEIFEDDILNEWEDNPYEKHQTARAFGIFLFLAALFSRQKTSIKGRATELK